MKNNGYVIKSFDSFKHFQKINHLTHKTLAEIGLVDDKNDSEIELNPLLNRSGNTNIIIAEYQNDLIGTCSITKDSDLGLNTDFNFKRETDELRKQYSNLGSIWRILTSIENRTNIKMIKELIKRSAETAKRMGIETCIFTIEDKRVSLYKKLVGASVIANKECYISPVIDKKMKITLMKCNIDHAINKM